MKILSKEIQEYIATQVLPALENGGLRKMAVLLSEDIFAQTTATNVHASAKVGKITISSFNSMPACINWLESN